MQTQTFDYQQFVDNKAESEMKSNAKAEFFEKEPGNLKAGIRIRELKKVFNVDSGKIIV